MNSSKQKTIEDAKNSLMCEIQKTKKLTDLEIMKETMNQIKEISKTIKLQTIQKFVILFYSYYNHLTEQNEYSEKLIHLSLFMIENFNKKNILELIKNEILNIFSKDNILFLIDNCDKIDEDIICYNLAYLSKNIDLMIIYFEEYLNASIFDYIKYKNLNLENPFTENLFNSIFKSIYDKMKENKLNDINLIIKNTFDDPNFTINTIPRCESCFNIMKIISNAENKYEIKCDNCDNEFKKYNENELLDLINKKFNCYECDSIVILYEDNYKCETCKNIICFKCKDKHFNNCFSINYLNLFEVGYKCEIHNMNYIQYCFECEKNICKECKEIHSHKTNENSYIKNELNKKIELYLKNQENKKTNLAKDEIKNNLSKIYLNIKKRKLFNGHLTKILCQLFDINLSETKKDILFNEFNDEEFKKYYSKIFTKISEGNLYYLNRLENIRALYEEKAINSYKYSNQLIIKREKNVALLIELTKSFINYLDNNHKFLNYDKKINNLQLQNDDLKTKINEIKLELLQNKNANKLLRDDSHNILCRFLVDELLKIIVVKFQDKLNKVALKINLILDIIYEHGENTILNNDILDQIEKISDDFASITKEIKNNPKNNELKEKLMNLLNSSSKINFVDDVKIKDETFNKRELNEILDVLYFIKKQGNQAAHPNIKSDEYINFKNIDKLPLKFEEESGSFYTNEIEQKVKKEINKKLYNKQKKKKCAKSIINNININDANKDDKSKYYNFSELNLNNEELLKEYDILSNIGNNYNLIENKIQEKIKNFRNKLLERFDNNIMKKKTNVSEIIEVIFEGQDEMIFTKANNFVKIIINDTDDVIKKNYCLNLLKKFNEENKNLNSLKNWLKDIKNILSGIDWLKICKHKNIEKIINQKVIENSDKFSNYISFITFLESINISESDINCAQNDLIAEACILLLSNLYNKEIKFYHYLMKTYENFLIKNLVYEEISSKLNEIRILFEKRFSCLNEDEKTLTGLIKPI